MARWFTRYACHSATGKPRTKRTTWTPIKFLSYFLKRNRCPTWISPRISADLQPCREILLTPWNRNWIMSQLCESHYVVRPRAHGTTAGAARVDSVGAVDGGARCEYSAGATLLADRRAYP